MNASACKLLSGILLLAAVSSAQAASTQDRIKQFGAAATARLQPAFEEAGVAYPPKSIAILTFKKEKVVQLYATGADGEPRFIRSYPVVHESGTQGPKLREGDRQVPEGIYKVPALNPNSQFHTAIRLDYPNAFDRARAREENRSNLGSDIEIHGNAESLGCVVVENEAVEELFTLANKVGISNVTAIIAPEDFRQYLLHNWLAKPKNAPKWTGELYDHIDEALDAYPSPRRS